MKRRVSMPESIMPLLPKATQPPVAPEGFVLFAMAGFPSTSGNPWPIQQWLYQQAFAEAQAVVRPSLPERDLLGVWN